jgi:hypothetical protein
MRKVVAASATISIVVLMFASSASAFEGGGRKPSEAPLITVGQHYTGQLNNHKDDANYGGGREVALYRLPPMTTRDVVTIDWHGLPFTNDPGDFPIRMVFAQGIDDFNWGSVFESATDCCSNHSYELSGSGTARSEIVAQETNATSSYLEFYDYASETNPSDFETFPYDFSVEPILHYLAAAIQPVKRVSASGILRATANLATGLPAPDGLPFSLSVTWPGGGVASYTAASSGGIAFQLALPESAYGKQATFVAGHPADGTYQAVTTSKLEVLVARPKPPRPTSCFLAERRELALARQFKRLKRHANRAHGASRAILNRRARQAKRKLRVARAEVGSSCGTA